MAPEFVRIEGSSRIYTNGSPAFRRALAKTPDAAVIDATAERHAMAVGFWQRMGHDKVAAEALATQRRDA